MPELLKPGDKAFLHREHCEIGVGRNEKWNIRSVTIESRTPLGYVLEEGFWVPAHCLCRSRLYHIGEPCQFCGQSSNKI